VQKLGNMVYASRRELVFETASRCSVRGGEYTLYDRASPQSAEAFYKSSAEAGDPVAQYSLGIVYESLYSPPRYEDAARWYAAAATQDHEGAQQNLAFLYDRGLGVEQDRLKAINLLRTSEGITDDLVFRSDLAAVQTQAEKQIAQLTQALEAQNAETVEMRTALVASQAAIFEQKKALQKSRTNNEELKRKLSRSSSGTDETLAAEYQRLQRELASSERTIADQELAIATMEADNIATLARLQASITKGQLQEERLTDQLTQAQAELQSTIASAEALDAQKDARIRDLNTQIRNLVRNYDEQLASAADLPAREIAEQNSRIATLVASIDERERVIAQQAYDMSLLKKSLEEQASGSGTTISTQVREINLLNTQLVKMAKELDLQKDAYAALSAQLGDAQDGDADSQVDAIVFDRLNQEIARRSELINDQSARIAALEEQIAESSDTIDLLRADSDQLVDERQILQAQLVSTEAELIKAKADLASVEVSLEQVRNDAVTLLEEKRGLEQRLAATTDMSEEDLRNARADLARREEALAASNRRIASLEAELDERLDELATATEARTQTLALRSLPTTVFPDVPDYDLPGNKYALIIGNDDYENLSDLTTAVNGALAVDSVLRESYGFKTTVLINARRNQIMDAFAKLRPVLKPEDQVLIYYAGHGERDQFDKQVSYWLPVEARADKLSLSADGIKSIDITLAVRAMDARHVLIIADSC
jgi:hypothetical protein